MSLHERYARALRENFFGAPLPDPEIYIGDRLDDGEALTVPLSAFDRHAFFAGGSGYGKTKALENLIRQVIKADVGAVVLIDPSDTAEAVKRWCYEHGLQRRLVIVSPYAVHQHQAFISVNPVSMKGEPQRRAALTAEVLRSVMGNDQFFRTPLLARWIYNTTVALVYGRLGMTDATHLLDTEDNRWREQIAVHIPLADVRSDWQWLARAWAKDERLFEERVASATNRLRFYLHNPFLHCMLGGTVKGIDWNAVLDERKIVIVDLNDRDNVLGQEEQSLLGQQIVEDLCATLRQRPEHERRPCYLFIDELSQFVSPSIPWILDKGRKFGIRLIAAFQYVAQLIDIVKNDPRAYQALLANCDLRVVFGGGLDAEDAERFATEFHGPFVDPFRVKQEIRTVRQTTSQVMMEIRSYGRFSGRTTGRTTGYSETTGHSHSAGSSTGSADTSSRSETLDLPALGAPLSQSVTSMAAHMASSAVSDSVTESSSSGYSEAFSEVESEGETESVTIAPVNVPSEPFYESKFEYQDTEEQLFVEAARMRRMGPREAVLSLRGREPVTFRTGEVPDPRVGFSWGLFLDAEYYASRLSDIAYSVEEVEEEIREREKRFLGPRPRPATRPVIASSPALRAKRQNVLGA